MNIFVTNNCPVLSAQALDNVRVNKMILESAQMLATSMHINGLSGLPLTKAGNPYKPTHRNHPCTQWASRSSSNYKWLLDHFLALLDEYSHRTGNVHSCENAYQALLAGLSGIPLGPLEPFQNSSGQTGTQDVTLLYQQCMNAKWTQDKIKVKWAKRNPPTWIATATHQVGDIWYRS